MPRKVTAWACKFRCGRKTDTVKKRMVEHEARCRMNPDRRACPTCKNWLKEWETFARLCAGEMIEEEYPCWFCDIDKNPNPSIGSKEEKQDISPFVYDCEHWEPKESEAE